jgi:predicted nuclease with TOPRIM domain
VSTNTIVSDIIAEHDARQRTQQTRTPKEVHARMIEMTNAANGLRYEVARFGDIERQLKAVHEKMEPLVLKAKELNDLICERVSQASQPWAIHELEELVQKVQQLERENAEQCVLLGKGGERECALLGKVERLERENAELRRDVYQCPPTSENGYEGLTWSDAFEVLERDNAALRDDRNELRTALFAQQKQQSESNREWAQESAELKIRLGVLERENAALREKMKVSWDEISVLVNQNSALLEALKTIAKYDQNSPHGDGICPYGCDCPSIANTALIKARKEAQP